VGLTWLGGDRLDTLPATFGHAAFERLVSRLERARAAGDLSADAESVTRSLRVIANRAGRGSVLLLFSDLVDLPEGAERAIVALGGGKRSLVVVQVLDAVERNLSFRGKVRLRSIEGDDVVVTDADAVRRAYQERLTAHCERWRKELEGNGGRLIEATSNDDAVTVVRRMLQAIAEVRS
jgi:uncharacterized protein (DUF58 family)